MDASALTGFFSSTSYCSAYMRSIENAESYLAAFRKELLEAAGNDQLRVDFEVELVTAHRC